MSKFSVEREKQFEMELEVDFEFLTKKEMLDDQHMTTFLNSIDFISCICTRPEMEKPILTHNLREEIEQCVATAEKEPKRKIRLLDG